VSNLIRLMALRREYESSPLRHTLTRVRDYIDDPKDDGYRSVHLMYRFSGKGTSLPWNKLRIEIQMRTALQHAWATSVETVDAFTGEDLKFGSGSIAWKRFFQLIGSVHARIEKTTLIPGTPASEAELWEEVRDLENSLQVVRHLRSYASLTEHITGRPHAGREWYLVKMLPEENKVTVAGYPLEKFRDAKRLLAEAEKDFEGTKNQAVLVKTNSLRELKKAYPNYFADTANFTSILDKFLQRKPLTIRRPSPAQGNLF
jgi:Region found in RelA / SpoT proteins